MILQSSFTVINTIILGRQIFSHIETIECIKTNIGGAEQESKEAVKRFKSLEINLEGREPTILDAFSKFILHSSVSLGAISGPPSTPPTQFDRWTVLSSPHVHKTARTQFERRSHHRLVQVWNLHPELQPKLVWYLRQHAPPDVKVDCSIHNYVPLP